MNYKDLYKPNLYYDDPKVDLYCRRRGFIKKKVVGLREQLGFNQGSDKVYFCFQQRGRILSYYNDNVKKGSELLGTVQVLKITDLQEEVKGKKGHFVVKMGPNESLHLKCDDVKESGEWIKTIKFFRDYYKSEKNNIEEAISTDVDMETKVKLQSEIELENWESISSKFDYTSFVKDKGLSTIFEHNILELIKNRLLISSAQKETKNKKDVIMAEPQTVNTPTTPMTPTRMRDRFNLNSITGSQYYFVLICQRPINLVDQEFALTDDVILEKETLPDWMEFNKLYYFDYSAKGDITPFKKSFNVS